MLLEYFPQRPHNTSGEKKGENKAYRAEETILLLYNKYVKGFLGIQDFGFQR